VGQITTADLASIDEFHIRGRAATLELAGRMEIGPRSRVLDIGSGLGGPARTLAETFGCTVIGVDLTPELCAAATALTDWVGLTQLVRFQQGDATALAFAPESFDAVLTIHTAMNIAAKDVLYANAYRVLRPGRIFAIYDIVQGEGGAVHFPVPWARDPGLSHLAPPDDMRRLLEGAGFRIIDERDTTEEALAWFRAEMDGVAQEQPRPVRFRSFLGDDAVLMAQNQVRNLAERRIRTMTYICRR
jgi:ubiquinone/menaquinone biosynthesis C-methylase UbiE